MPNRRLLIKSALAMAKAATRIMRNMFLSCIDRLSLYEAAVGKAYTTYMYGSADVSSRSFLNAKNRSISSEPVSMRRPDSSPAFIPFHTLAFMVSPTWLVALGG